MSEPARDDRHPEEQASNMFNQVTTAFGLPWPRKPLGKPTGGKPHSTRGRGHSSRGGKKAKNPWFG